MTTAQANYTHEELEAIWQHFQRSENLDCPNCGEAKVRVELISDPAESGGGKEAAEIEAKCDNCGRTGTYQPGEEKNTYGWID